jgi:hypothetical protein
MILALFAVLSCAAPAFAEEASKGSSVSGWLAVALLPLAWPFLKKFIVGRLVGGFVDLVGSALEAGDEDDDRLILAVVHWVEVKAKKLDAQGPDKFKAVAKNLSSRVKYLRGHEDRLADLMEEVAEEMAEKAKDIESKAQPAAPPAPETPPA